MTAVAELGLRRPTLKSQEQKKSGILIVSKITIDHTAKNLGGHLPPEIAASYRAGDKASITPDQFHRLRAQSDFASSVGGNGPNIGHRLKQFQETEPENPTHNPITVYTWGNRSNEGLLRLDLTHPGMMPELMIHNGEMPEALVYPVTTTGKRPDRIILGTNPEMPSDFDVAVHEGLAHAVINSLPGTQWLDPLMKGTSKLAKLGIPYTYTPGTAQLKAVASGEGHDAVYTAIQGADALIVNADELKMLVASNGETPARKWTKLLGQGLDLGAQTVVVTHGRNGSFGATQEGKMVRVGVTQSNRVRGTLGAGDAFLAGFISREGDLEERLRRGSASGSFAVETVGAHENPPSTDQLTHRMNRRVVTVANLGGKRDRRPV
jgi:sugar/nucleoside kinase (ribokinase family)